MRYLLVFLLTCSAALAQVTTFNTKPMLSPWSPADVSAVEVRIKGRLSTDSATTHKIIARIPLKPFDWVTMLTMRVTILVPSGQTWEVKSLALGITPATSTGLAAFELATLTRTVPHQAPGGQMLAIDHSPKTGVTLVGPVSSTPQPPPHLTH